MSLKRKTRLVPTNVDGHAIEIPEIDKAGEEENASQRRAHKHMPHHYVRMAAPRLEAGR
jgi:hypothetical protein